MKPFLKEILFHQDEELLKMQLNFFAAMIFLFSILLFYLTCKFLILIIPRNILPMSLLAGMKN